MSPALFPCVVTASSRFFAFFSALENAPEMVPTTFLAALPMILNPLCACFPRLPSAFSASPRADASDAPALLPAVVLRFSILSICVSHCFPRMLCCACASRIFCVSASYVESPGPALSAPDAFIASLDASSASSFANALSCCFSRPPKMLLFPFFCALYIFSASLSISSSVFLISCWTAVNWLDGRTSRCAFIWLIFAASLDILFSKERICASALLVCISVSIVIFPSAIYLPLNLSNASIFSSSSGVSFFSSSCWSRL